MRTVVMVCFDFPPEGRAGVYRPLRFIRHLPERGWNPVVIAEETVRYERYDPQLLEMIPPQTEVIRVRNPDPWKAIQDYRARRMQGNSDPAPSAKAGVLAGRRESTLRARLRAVVRRIESTVYNPDPAMCWIRPATRAGVEACSRTGAEVVWATGGPWSSFVVAHNVWRRTGRPYVLDFRDSWTLTLSTFEARQPGWVQARDRQLLGRLLSSAQSIVFRYASEAEAYRSAYPGAVSPERVHLIPNGYEGAIAPSEQSRREHCTVLYTGMAWQYEYEGLLRGLRLLQDTDPAVARKLRVVFVGEGTDLIRSAADEHGVSTIVRTSGAVPSSEVSRLQNGADALLLLGWKPIRGNELGGSSKVFGYMKAGRPIVGVLPEDENRRVLQSLGVRTIASHASPTETMDVFRTVLECWANGDMKSLLPDPVGCEAYSAGPQTAALVRALEGRSASTPFIPGSAPLPASLQELIGPEGWLPAKPRRSFFHPWGESGDARS